MIKYTSKSSFPSVDDMLKTLRSEFDKKLNNLSDLEVAQRYAAETGSVNLTADDCKELFINFCEEALDTIKKINVATPGNDHMIEPKWWIDMMEAQQ